MIPFSNFLTERINSKRIQYDVIKNIIDELDPSSDTRLLTDVKRGVSNLLDKYVNDPSIKIKISVKYGTKTNGSAGVYINRKDKTVERIVFNIQISKGVKDTETLYNELIQTITHEVTHIVQQIRSGYELARSDVRNGITGKNSQYGNRFYLSDRAEVEAYAINAAQEIMSHGLDKNKVIAALPDKEKLFAIAYHFSPSLLRYYREFYTDSKTDREARKVWQTFIKKMLQHLQ